MLVRCNCCGKELSSGCCGCPNMTTVHGDVLSANDMSQVVLLQSNKKFKKESLFTPQELEYREARRKRKVRKLNFEER